MARIFKSVTAIFSPYHVGIYNHCVGAGPTYLRKHGIVEEIRSIGVDVITKEIGTVDEFEGEIGKSFEILRRTANLVREAKNASSFPLVLAGNCMSTVGVAAGLGDLKELGCIWFDAHDDYNTPSTMTSGYLDGTGVSMLSGESFQALTNTIPGHRPLNLKQFVYCGLRDVNEVERQRVINSDMYVVWGDVNQKVDFSTELGKAIDKRSLGNVMVHLDLDALDGSLGRVNQFSVPGGLFEEDLAGCMKQILTKTRPSSLTVASFDPHLGGEESISRIAIETVKNFMEILFQKTE